MADTAERPGFLRRAIRRIAIVTVTGVTLLGAGFAVTVGADLLQARATAAKPEGTAKPIPVSVSPVTFTDSYTVTRRFIGQVETAQSTDLAFEFAGLVSDVLIDEGSDVAKGDIIAKLDTALLANELERLQASSDALSAQLSFAQMSVERREQLKRDGFTATEAFDQAIATRDELTARLAETKAAMARTRIQIEKSTLTAPFDGRIAARGVDIGATVNPAQSIATLLQTQDPRVRVGLPLSINAQPGDTFTVVLQGVPHTATLRTLRPDVDPQTRTRTAILNLSDLDRPAYGQIVTVQFDSQVSAKGAWVPTRAMREGTQGLWTVLTVGDDNIVRPAAVEILHTEADRAFVRGSFAPGDRLLDSGPHRVTPGQTVRIAGEV
ncbi:efflux RND transporter periplasmic adaptor subunit [Actibacterium sp. 188UL27-1]|uniref:efflux RND transporter periplasmic adaptor subunit n=1 Tax=Actibacterium sp. 188UL27-1 TaxID=2786961 RepID=UPI00195D2B51|nr:efflux RND transporter periplasmic adaptor subunit [Actibacterium sp. 188UL27-1]MBM7068961.1 efflux RND transporter periplasmic adaptor subunit [Actibacterium sp. 188UL27-1]